MEITLKTCICILWNKFIFKEKMYSVQNFWNDPHTNITKCKSQVSEQWIKHSIPVWVHDYHLHNLKSSITDWLIDWLINWLGERPKSSSYIVGHTHSARKQLDPLTRWRRKPCSNPTFWEPFSYFWVDPSAAKISPSSILVLLLSPLVKSGNKMTDSNTKLMKFKWNCNITKSFQWLPHFKNACRFHLQHLSLTQEVGTRTAALQCCQPF